MKLHSNSAFLFSSLVLNSRHGEELHPHMHTFHIRDVPHVGFSPFYKTRSIKMIETISNILHNFLILGIALTIWTVGIFFGVLTIFEIWRKFNGKHN